MTNRVKLLIAFAAGTLLWIFLAVVVVVGYNTYAQHQAEHAALRQIINMINAQAAQWQKPPTPPQ